MSFIGSTQTVSTMKEFGELESKVEIPFDDRTAYKLYPKYRWVYSTSRILEMQGIEWFPFPQQGVDFALREFNFLLGSTEIYTRPLVGERLTTDAAVMKGDIKWAAHHVTNEDGTKVVLDDLRGNVELVISALATLHFKKFAGVISADTIGSKIISCRLRMSTDVIGQYPADWAKHIVRIYNRRPWGK